MSRNLLTEFTCVAAGGMTGALLRHGTNNAFEGIFGETLFVTATTVENILGSFLIGFIFSLLNRYDINNEKLNLFILTGIIGSYTTYSGFMVEAFLLLQQSALLFILYILSQITVGIIAVWLGISFFKKVE